MEWIRIEKQLPPERVPCLVHFKARYKGGDEFEVLGLYGRVGDDWFDLVTCCRLTGDIHAKQWAQISFPPDTDKDFEVWHRIADRDLARASIRLVK
jgi:hypothetical protein